MNERYRFVMLSTVPLSLVTFLNQRETKVLSFKEIENIFHLFIYKHKNDRIIGYSRYPNNHGKPRDLDWSTRQAHRV